MTVTNARDPLDDVEEGLEATYYPFLSCRMNSAQWTQKDLLAAWSAMFDDGIVIGIDPDFPKQDSVCGVTPAPPVHPTVAKCRVAPCKSQERRRTRNPHGQTGTVGR